MSGRTLTDADIEAVAQRVAAVLDQRRTSTDASSLLTAAEVAGQYAVSAGWVRENADRLGVIRIGTGTRPRLRFDAAVVAAAFAAEVSTGKRSGGRTSPPNGRSRAMGVSRRGAISQLVDEGWSHA